MSRRIVGAGDGREQERQTGYTKQVARRRGCFHGAGDRVASQNRYVAPAVARHE